MPIPKTKWQQALDARTPMKQKRELQTALQLRREKVSINLGGGRSYSVRRASIIGYLRPKWPQVTRYTI
jgi:hypothetical protein